MNRLLITLSLQAKRVLVGAALLLGSTAVSAQSSDNGIYLDNARAQFAQFARLHTIVAAHQGEIFFEETWGGPGPREPVNIKSLSKTVMSALAGIAIEQGIIESVDQPVVELLGDRVPGNATPGVETITVGNLLSMQAGLERTSGGNYGRWVVSNNWVNFVLTRPMVSPPGEDRLYSTGSSHLLSAALTEASGRSTHALAQDWLSNPLNVRLPPWPTDPQGIYFGGNDMVMSPLAILRFGEMYRQGGQIDGVRVLPEGWVEASWDPRGRSRWTSDEYGFGWFITEIAGSTAYYGRGYGGQILYVIPELEMTIAITSSPYPPSPGSGYVRQLQTIIEDTLVPAVNGWSGP